MYLALGFASDPADEKLSRSLDHANLRIRRKAIIVDTLARQWLCHGDQNFTDLIRQQGGLMLAVTTAIDPSDGLTFEVFHELLVGQQCALGWVKLSDA
ncbi:hypothetical protein [Rugosimonospora africana]|uniref:hypothetical protein n=1 Tax=Rugosimonospora africana TaxID=556532 RepID=UPI001941E059|nr:hypothetical protein [Rugosimonospora africana]